MEIDASRGSGDADEIRYSTESPTVWPIDEIQINATSAARRLARESGADIRDVSGTGKDGRVTKRDVEDYVN